MTVPRVLVVEDDALVGMYLAELLIGMGYDICAIAATEAEAVTAAVRDRPDLMIVDARLREGSGIAAVAQILQNLPIPHVFVSGDIASVQEELPRAVVLRKPFRESELASAIQRACV
ncbi:MAG: response regulator [Methylovirgula sp.]